MVTVTFPPAGPQGSGLADAPPEGLRERKKRATRRALRLAALSLAAERGLDHVTTEEIAAAADVSQRTFFNYFSSKEDAIVGNDPDVASRLSSALAARPAHETPLEALRAAFVTYAHAVMGDLQLWRLRLQVIQASPQLMAAMVGASAEMNQALATAIAARTGTDPAQDPYPALVANVATAASRTALQHCAAGDFTRPLPELMVDVFDALMHGLPTPSAG